MTTIILHGVDHVRVESLVHFFLRLSEAAGEQTQFKEKISLASRIHGEHTLHLSTAPRNMKSRPNRNQLGFSAKESPLSWKRVPSD